MARGACVVIPNPRVVIHCLRYSREANYLYLNNPKAACWTMKAALWHGDRSRYHPPLKHPEQVHSRLLWDVNFSGCLSSTVFCLTTVRNPFARVLSAYLDKIEKPGPVRRKFCVRYRLDPSKHVTFGDFLRLIARNKPDDDDPHWRPQVDGILGEYLVPDEIAHVERPNSIYRLLEKTVGSLFPRESRPHATNASDKVREYYRSSEYDLVVQKYRDDFDFYGYSLDLDEMEPSVPRVSRVVEGRLLERMVDAIGDPGIDSRIVGLSEVLRSTPRHASLASYLAEQMNDHNLNREALAVSTAAIEADGEHAEGYLERARALLRFGHDEEALDSLEHAIACKRDLKVAWIQKADILRRRNDSEGFHGALGVIGELGNGISDALKLVAYCERSRSPEVMARTARRKELMAEIIAEKRDKGEDVVSADSQALKNEVRARLSAELKAKRLQGRVG
jgi:tetratricopeptide (TPR) repeat protein